MKEASELKIKKIYLLELSKAPGHSVSEPIKNTSSNALTDKTDLQDFADSINLGN